MNKKIIALLPAACMAYAVSAAALEIDGSVKIDYEQYGVTVSAVTDEWEQPVGLYLTDSDGNTAAFFQKNPDVFGKAEFSFRVDEDFAGKPLTLRISQIGEKTAEKILYITKKSEIDAWLEGYKSKNTASELEAHTAPYIDSVLKNELDVGEYEEFKDRLFDILKNFKNDYKSVSELALDIRKSVAVVKINEYDEKSLKTFFADEKTKELLSIDFNIPENAYSAFMLYRSDKSHMETVRTEGALFASPDEAVCALREVSCIAEVNAAQASEMESILKTHTATLEKAKAGFSNLMKRYTSPAGRGLVGKQFTSLKSIALQLEESIIEVEKEKNKTDGGGGSGAGGAVKTYKGAEAVLTPEIIEENGFSDMENHPWAQEAVVNLTERKIVNGKTKTRFAPDDFITREEFVKMAVLLFNIYDPSAETDFSDVADGTWFYSYVASAVQNGIVTGRSAECFGTGEYITRQDIVTILGRALEKRGVMLAAAEKSASDIDAANDYSRTYINKFFSKGIVSGTGSGNFEPLKNATRAESAVIVNNVLGFIEGVQ